MALVGRGDRDRKYAGVAPTATVLSVRSRVSSIEHVALSGQPTPIYQQYKELLKCHYMN